MTKFMTKEQREKVSNRLILNFGILLCGALIMLYVYNFISAGYVNQAQNVVGVIAIISAIAAIVFAVLGKVKNEKLFKWAPVFLGMFIAGAITFLPRLIPALTAKNAVIIVFLLMLVYFIVMAVITAVILKTHPEQPKEKKAIHHAKKKKRK